ncbi:MAG: methyltransferase [Alphaproteobacteria bacterium]|nr:methyltransferase [Alphaproteobacteria bacterium]
MTAERADEIHVLGRRVRLLQPPNGFRTSLDSVMLAAACPVQTNQTVLDLGCGVGGAGLCLLKRADNAQLHGFDIQEDHIELARQNAALNSMENRSSFHVEDLINYVALKKARAREKPEDRRQSPEWADLSFDHVICNPPYMDAGAHMISPHEAKAVAHGHQDKGASIKDWLDAGYYALKSGGSLTLIHRADQTDKIVRGLGQRFGAVEIIPLWPRTGVPAKRVIIRAIKHRKSPALLHQGLVLHGGDGAYTPEAENILRGGAALL